MPHFVPCMFKCQVPRPIRPFVPAEEGQRVGLLDSPAYAAKLNFPELLEF
jgi:hypothetical protein